jgi:hypothetical protein
VIWSTTSSCARRPRIVWRFLAGADLREPAEVCADDRRDLRVAAQTRPVDAHGDRLDSAWNLNPADRDRVVDDVGRV